MIYYLVTLWTVVMITDRSDDFSNVVVRKQESIVRKMTHYKTLKIDSITFLFFYQIKKIKLLSFLVLMEKLFIWQGLIID